MVVEGTLAPVGAACRRQGGGNTQRTPTPAKVGLRMVLPNTYGSKRIFVLLL